MTLKEWQATLEQHFADLKALRLSLNRSSHIFALEHGLDSAEVDALSAEIREFARQSSPAERHWLAWVVYATEIGYVYSGDEYWNTFEERTPGWSTYDQFLVRDYIRDAFHRFHREYGGVKPTGRWASHFSIICWPITHAVLPRDFQEQLAEILYEIRHGYDEGLLSDPTRLGKAIEHASFNASRRFQKFAEQHLLVGQIASALLESDDRQVDNAIILPATLKRIAADLDQKRRSREWLSTARSRALTVKVRGAQRGVGQESTDSPSDDVESGPREQLIRLGIEPSVGLRLIAQNTWEVHLHLPSLAPLLTKFPLFRSILTEQRCHVIGAKDNRPLARQRLLRGDTDVTLGKWPAHDQVLLRFESSCPQLDHLLTTECLLRPGPQWLFKVLGDGSAVEVKSKTIRPGTTYIELSADGCSFSSLNLRPTAIACDGVKGWVVEVPGNIPYNLTRALNGTGYSIASSLSLWPTGVAPSDWDSEGHIEYLSTDSPCIAVSSDFECNGLILNLEGSRPSQLNVTSVGGSDPVIAELGTLPIGSHALHVITSHNGDPISATLRISVRAPSSVPTRPMVMSVLTTPANPTLEELWSGRASVEIYGPEGSRIHGDIALFSDLGCTNKLAAGQFGPLTTPVESSALASIIHNLSSTPHMQNAYDEAVCSVMKFRCIGLGENSITCEREPSPCRWAVKHENHAYWIRLVQSDEIGHPTFFYCSFLRPDLLEPRPGFDFRERIRVPDRGGLYYANKDRTTYSVVIPPIIRSLQELRLPVVTIDRPRSESDLGQVLLAIELWHSARIVGDPISVSRKEDVLSSLSYWLARTLCGSHTLVLQSDEKTEASLQTMRDYIRSRHPGLAIALRNLEDQITGVSIEHCAAVLARHITNHLPVAEINLGQTHGISSLQWLTEFGLRVFEDPQRVREWAGHELFSGLHYLLRFAEVARVCRFAFLVRDLHGKAAELTNA